MKYTWYQNQHYIFIDVLIKGVTKCNVHVLNDTLIIDAQQAPCGSGSPTGAPCGPSIPCGAQQHQLKLYSSDFSLSQYTPTNPFKIAIKLCKSKEYMWPVLEAPVAVEAVQGAVKADEKLPSAYSSKKDWNKITAEEFEKEPEVESDMDSFRKLYNEGSNYTKRMMNKSYIESGGIKLKIDGSQEE
jgi:hypothetical protein